MTDGYLVRFDLSRRKAESGMQTGGAPSEVSVSALFSENASLFRSEESLDLASVQGNLGIPTVARQMRRLCGPRGCVARKDVLAATDANGNSRDEGDFRRMCCLP